MDISLLLNSDTPVSSANASTPVTNSHSSAIPDTYVDIAALMNNLQNHFHSQQNRALAPQEVAEDLRSILDRSTLTGSRDGSPTSLPSSSSESSHSLLSSRSSLSSSSSARRSPVSRPSLPLIEFNVPINRKTRLSKLLRIDDEADTPEYPETSTIDPVGYLHRLDPTTWVILYYFDLVFMGRYVLCILFTDVTLHSGSNFLIWAGGSGGNSRRAKKFPFWALPGARFWPLCIMVPSTLHFTGLRYALCEDKVEIVQYLYTTTPTRGDTLKARRLKSVASPSSTLCSRTTKETSFLASAHTAHVRASY
ncbi:hypothetical protein BDZ89DRAFT_1136498 [Hymenopellis radicata]|nr:hypothetical protein BDZ89DRAFT_1136498 [Hymenopellis radicata]